MSFFNSLSIRITLALIGGILYGLLTCALALVIDLSVQFGIGVAFFVSLLYIGSRLLLLFSGIDTPYYSKERKDSPYAHTAFNQTAQWVGKFYHYHDIVLFVFLTILAVIFIISLVIDGFGNRPFGQSIQDLWNKLALSF